MQMINNVERFTQYIIIELYFKKVHAYDLCPDEYNHKKALQVHL